MAFAQKVAVAVSLTQPMTEVLKGIKSLDFLKDAEVHFVSVNQTAHFVIGLGESAIVYPLEDDKRKIQEETLHALKDLSHSLLPSDFKGKMYLDCLFSEDPKTKFCDFVEEKNIDTVIVAAREKRGLFESSFTNYVNKHSKANIVILKHII